MLEYKEGIKKAAISLTMLTMALFLVINTTGCDDVEGPIDFSQFDTNKDGRISQEEFRKSGYSLTEFSKLDTNNDKHISKKEFNFLKINF